MHSLKSVFRKGIAFENYSELLSAAKHKSTGNLPKDLINIVVSEYPKSARGEVISQIKDSYFEAAKILSNVEKAELQAFKRLPANDKTYKSFNNKIDNISDFENMPSTSELYPFKDNVFKEKETEFAIMAEQAMVKKLSQIMPDLKNIIITPLGEGNFSITYKTEFIFHNSDKIVRPQVLKVFRKSLLSERQLETQLKYFHNASNRAIADVEHCSVNNAKRSRQRNIKELNNTLNEVRNGNYGHYGHGALAEANAAEYIRYMTTRSVGANNGIVLSDFYSFEETPYAVSKFVEDGISIKHPFDFKKLGLYHSDFENNPANSIGGICVDIGGILPLITEKFGKKSCIAGSKTATKISKEFSKLKTPQEKTKYLENLIDEYPLIKDNVKRREILEAADEILGTRMNEIC